MYRSTVYDSWMLLLTAAMSSKSFSVAGLELQTLSSVPADKLVAYLFYTLALLTTMCLMQKQSFEHASYYVNVLECCLFTRSASCNAAQLWSLRHPTNVNPEQMIGSVITRFPLTISSPLLSASLHLSFLWCFAAPCQLT